MNLTVLHVEGCPSLEPLLDELRTLLGAHAGVTLTTVPVESEQQAEHLGFHGSPTLLIDGVDPFPFNPVATGLACRVYADLSGRLTGVPSRASLSAALGVQA